MVAFSRQDQRGRAPTTSWPMRITGATLLTMGAALQERAVSGQWRHIHPGEHHLQVGAVGGNVGCLMARSSGAIARQMKTNYASFHILYWGLW